ncbi:MAG TPA: hypothetical protein ENG89_00480 [Candidatus Moranbacteria bacterium]|nr:hypothetical protein [Candidatus Moranbacteria bacterium]
MLTNVIIWVLSGLFVAFLMRTVDEKGPRSDGKYWIKNLGISSIIALIALAPLSLLLGIGVMADYCERE